MPRYFFHLVGDLPARDVLGHECADDKEAGADARTIAHRIGTRWPAMVREENYVSVVNEDDVEIGRVMVSSYTA